MSRYMPIMRSTPEAEAAVGFGWPTAPSVPDDF